MSKSQGDAQDAANRKVARLNIQKQKLRDKRQEMWLQRRIGSPSGPPKVIGMINLSTAADSRHLLSQCVSSADWNSAISDFHVNASYSQLKARFTFLLPAHGNDLLGLLDLSKSVDVLLLVVSATQGPGAYLIDEEISIFLSAIKAAGMPEVVVCVQGLNTLSGKALFECKKRMQQFMNAALFDDVKIVDVSDASLLLRSLTNSTTREVSWR